MKDMLDIEAIKTSRLIKPVVKMDLLDQTPEYIRMIAEEFHDARQPFYRIWYYQKQGWATGYTDEAIKFLKMAFNRIKKNEQLCRAVLHARRQHTKMGDT